MKASWNIGLFAAVASLVACGGGGPDHGVLATLEAFDNGLTLPVDGTISVSAGGLAVGEEDDVSEIRLINTGEDPLIIDEVTIDSVPAGVFRLAGDTNGGALPSFPLRVDPESAIEGNTNAYLYLMFTRPAEGEVPTATITIRSNSVSSEGVRQEQIVYHVALQNTAATIQVTPRAVNFGTVPQGDSEQRSINILNPGSSTLLVNSFTLSGHPNFELVIGAKTYKVTAESASAGIVLEQPLAVESGITVPVTVRYTATDRSEARGQVVFFSNDPNAAGGTVVSLQANVGGPCITVNPRKVAFGGKLVGKLAKIDVEITSCGDQPLTMTEIGLTPDSSARYSLALETLPGVGTGSSSVGPADAPVVLQPNQKATLTVQFFPEEVSPVDGNNQPIYDLGTLRIRSNSFEPELLVELTGFGVEKECPTALIIVREGEEVIPQTTLHLTGSQSTAASGEIAEYHWEVDQPEGSGSVFSPGSEAADPTFDVNVAGRYVFRLTVVDSTNEPSCVPAEYEVFVNPDEAIHIELLWDTPNDNDQTDENGADLDMHFVHPLAVGSGNYDGDRDGLPDGYFDIPFDCFWANKQPNWASLDQTVDDNPGLDLDDTDGTGPENLNLNIPENGKLYKVGVHYWDDHGFGISYATLRVYIYANMVFEVDGVELFKHDMWTVTNIAWPPTGVAPEVIKVCSGGTTACESDAECGGGTCGYRIAPNYQNPDFIQP